MARFKRNVTVTFTQTNLWLIEAFDQAMRAVVGMDSFVTSGLEGTHSPNSGHYYGRALDFRSHHLSQAHKDMVLEKVKAYLTEHAKGTYYVSLEQPGTDNEHFHAQRNKGSF